MKGNNNRLTFFLPILIHVLATTTNSLLISPHTLVLPPSQFKPTSRQLPINNHRPPINSSWQGVIPLFSPQRTVSLSRCILHMTNSSPSTIPNHIAIIPDGNARWATQNSLPLFSGHAMGSKRAISTIRYLHSRGVKCVTVYIFSTENWNRGVEEIKQLWGLLERSIVDLEKEWKNVKIRLLGDTEDDRLPLTLRQKLSRLQEEGDSSDKELTICLAINYGGRKDILSAAKHLVLSGKEPVDEDDFSTLLSTNGLPTVDLVIRTGGERRLSNFLLWDVAYSELYFSDVLWPDFDEKCVDEALSWFQERERRFGGRC